MFCRTKSVAVLIHARPPSQPFTLGGWKSCWPIRSPACDSALISRVGVPRLRIVCTISCVGLFTTERRLSFA